MEGETGRGGQREGGREAARGQCDTVSTFSFLTGPEEMTSLWTRGAIPL